MSALDQLLKSASCDTYYTGTSGIAGQGIFASKDCPVATTVALAMTPGDKDEFDSQLYHLTHAARFCNHQNKPNCAIKKTGEGYDLVTIKRVPQDSEFTVDYRQVARALGPRTRMQWEGKDVPVTDFRDYVEKEKSQS